MKSPPTSQKEASQEFSCSCQRCCRAHQCIPLATMLSAPSSWRLTCRISAVQPTEWRCIDPGSPLVMQACQHKSSAVRCIHWPVTISLCSQGFFFGLSPQVSAVQDTVSTVACDPKPCSHAIRYIHWPMTSKQWYMPGVQQLIVNCL